ncbi:ABC transporter permease [Alkalibaculum sp. M08DMB]|uniref:Transport permease protein n=1 Tax=Alkalibaculum sporogenes TaxID=2655001 RepID=A0A6A7K941_9FIRM|nr:ABC transporter permease [Alkalibaculum sporogenes]MPW25875.1 ABC transporter permease [Alkalibaculum sporogenes]
MNILFRHLIIQFKIDIRDNGTLMTYYFVPLLFYFVMGAVFSSVNPISRETLAASMTIFSVTMGAVLGMPAPIVRMYESGVLRGFKVYGIPAWAVFFIQGISTGLHLTIVSLVIFFTAPLFYGANIVVNIPAYFVTLTVLLFTMLAIGLLIGVLARSQSVAMMLSQVVFLPTMMLGGIMFPAELLPEPLRILGQLLPATYIMQAFTDSAYNLHTTLSTIPALIITLGIGFIAIICSIIRYKTIARSL